MSDRLPLYQELWLLGHDDDGMPHIHLPSLCVGLAGAVLVELVMAERVTIRDAHIVLYDHAATGEPFIDATLTTIVRNRGQRPLPLWIRGMAGDIHERVTGALIAAGVVVRETRRHLLRRRERYLPTDPMIAVRVRGAVTHTVYGREYPDWQCAALCGLVGVLGLHDALYLSAPSTELRSRLAEITGWHHPDVQAVIAAVDGQIGDTAISVYR